MKNILLALGLLLGFLSTQVALPFGYFRGPLTWLLDASVIVSGEIVVVDDTTFVLEVEEWIGGTGEARITFKRFVDYTGDGSGCGGDTRWEPYEVGQRVLIFGSLPKKDVAFYTIIGAAGEGEFPLIDDDLITRTYRVGGRLVETKGLYGQVEIEERVNAAEWIAAVRGFRELYQYGGRGRWHVKPLQGSPLLSSERVAAFAATSKMGQFLADEVDAQDRQAPYDQVRRPRVDRLPTWSRDLVFDAPRAALVRASPLTPRPAAVLGDLDGDGVDEYAVCGSEVEGDTLWIVFPGEDGAAKRHVEINSSASDAIPNGWGLPSAVTSLGDLDGDGVPDLAVGYQSASSFADGSGAVLVLFLTREGGVKSSRSILQQVALSETLQRKGAIPSELGLGTYLAVLGDLDGDGFPELVIGRDIAPSLELEQSDFPTEFIVSLDSTGATRWVRSRGSSVLEYSARSRDRSYVGIGDLDGDGVPDMAIGHPLRPKKWLVQGGVWIVFLRADGSVRKEKLLARGQGAFLYSERLGAAVACPGDQTGDGIPDLLLSNHMGIWLVALKRDGSPIEARLALAHVERPADTSLACSPAVDLPGRQSTGDSLLLIGTASKAGLHRTTLREALKPGR